LENSINELAATMNWRNLGRERHQPKEKQTKPINDV